MVLTATAGTKTQSYVVLPGRVAPVSDFTAKLLLSSRQLVPLKQAGTAKPVSAAELEPGAPFGQERDWPVDRPEPVNSPTSRRAAGTPCATFCEALTPTAAPPH